MDITADRAERGRLILKDYYGQTASNGLASVLADLIAYADTLGPAAFANNLNAALGRLGKPGVSFPDPSHSYLERHRMSYEGNTRGLADHVLAAHGGVLSADERERVSELRTSLDAGGWSAVDLIHRAAHTVGVTAKPYNASGLVDRPMGCD